MERSRSLSSQLQKYLVLHMSNQLVVWEVPLGCKVLLLEVSIAPNFYRNWLFQNNSDAMLWNHYTMSTFYRYGQMDLHTKNIMK